jgi:hypothetical protein
MRRSRHAGLPDGLFSNQKFGEIFVVLTVENVGHWEYFMDILDIL